MDTQKNPQKKMHRIKKLLEVKEPFELASFNRKVG